MSWDHGFYFYSLNFEARSYINVTFKPAQISQHIQKSHKVDL